MNKVVLSFIICFTISIASVCYANEEKDINISELIFEHTNDAYEWHLVTLGQKHITIPLPVIVYSKTSGLHVFMSSKLKHTDCYRGFSFGSREGNHAGKIVEKTITGEEYRPIDISITKNVVSLFITVFILLFCVLYLARWYKRHGEYKVPRGFLGAIDMLIIEINDDVIKKCIVHNHKRYAPYLLTVFFFILISNLLGLIPIFPGGANLTGNIAITFILALCTFVLVNFSGTKHYWKEIFWPDVPVWMKIPLPLLPLVELFGVFTKPFALMIRLFANVLAGHAVMIGLCCIIFMTASLGLAINSTLSFIAILIMIFMSFIELLVAVVQAYVFTLLSAVFISLAQAQPHRH
jgi:F-type H+-transporting ATPase subunit a